MLKIHYLLIWILHLSFFQLPWGIIYTHVKRVGHMPQSCLTPWLSCISFESWSFSNICVYAYRFHLLLPPLPTMFPLYSSCLTSKILHRFLNICIKWSRYPLVIIISQVSLGLLNKMLFWGQKKPCMFLCWILFFFSIICFTVNILSAQNQPCQNPFCFSNNMTSTKSWILLLIIFPSRRINPR